MFKITKLVAVALLALGFTATSTAQEDNGPQEILTPVDFYITAPLRSYPQVLASDIPHKVVPRGGSEKRKDKAEIFESVDQYKSSIDHAIQTTPPTRVGREPIQNFDGINLNVSPPDPSAAVGPNHIVQMTNGVWSVWDKQGNQEAGFPKNLSDPLGAGSGDPIVFYDREADRWFISQFRDPFGNSRFLVAISTTSDPGGTYAVYVFNPQTSNDYPHFSVYGNSYAVSGNFGNPSRVFLMNREKMINGDDTAEMVGFNLPDYRRPSNPEGNNFSAVMPVHSEGAGIAEGAVPFLYFEDDNWTNVTEDAYVTWEVTIDWDDTDSAEISDKNSIVAAEFDAHLRGQGAGGVFSNLMQPGTPQRIDAIVGAIMYMAHRYDFGTYESMVFNFVVEPESNTLVSGIRWVELRKNEGEDTWTVYQEGTYVDPVGEESVFMGCIGMDAEGNIALGYTKTGPDTFPSLYYTGRKSTDELGIMSVAEVEIVAGITSVTQSGNNRYGDYGQLTRDPEDDLTFWMTSEYDGQPRKTRIASFKISEALSIDELVASDKDFAVTSTDNQNFDVNLFTNTTNDILRLSVFNTLGQRVVFDQVERQGPAYTYTLNMSNMTSGVYIVTLGNSKTKLSKKIIVK